MEELQSALASRGLTVSKLPEKGRGLFATRDFTPGEVIIRQEPYACVPQNSGSENKCDGCFKSGRRLKKCSGCLVVYYCSGACQKSERKLHSLECEAFSKLPKMFHSQMSPRIRLIIRLHCRSKLQSQKIIPTSAMDNYKLVEALVAHMSEIDEELRMLHARTANLVTCILMWPEINKKEVAENSSKYSRGSQLLFVPCNIYPKELSTLARQKALQECYLFTCTCPCCIKAGQYNDIQERAVLEGYRCKDDECAGLLLHDSDDNGFICQQCGCLKSKEEIQVMESKIKSLQKKALAAAESAGPSISCQEAIAVYKEIETLQRQLCHPLCIKLLPTWKGIIQNSMKLEDWRQALAYSRLTIPVYQRVYPAYHPLLGLQYYTCGKLEGLLGETKNAVTSLTKAWNMLKITHGKTTPFMKNLFSML